MRVEFRRKHREPQLHTKFDINEVANIPAHLAFHLNNLQICKILEPDPHPDPKLRNAFNALRIDLGVRPYDPHVIFGGKRIFANIRNGDKILIIRKYGGFGDILICSYLLSVIHEKYPDNELTFSTPTGHHEWFRGIPWLKLIKYDGVFENYRQIRGGVIQSEVADRYDIVEDVSTPCHIWESLFGGFGFDKNGLKWQNRIEIWGHWIGINNIKNPKSCIKIRNKEIKDARDKYVPELNGKPLCILAPMSALKEKNYPYYRQIENELSSKYRVIYMAYPEQIPGAIKTKTLREMTALVGAADLVVAVDSAIMHAAAVMNRPCVGIFNINDGETYCKFYPTVHPVQLCDTPCIMKRAHECDANGKRVDQICYRPNSVTTVMAKVRIIERKYKL